MSSLPIEGLDGRSDRTKGGHGTAVNKWNEFTVDQNARVAALAATTNTTPPVIPKFEELTQDFVCGRVLENGTMENRNNPPIAPYMAQFSQFLLDDVKPGGNPYAPKVTVQYLSGFKTALFKKFPPLTSTNETPEWYDELYQGLNLRSTAECIRRGGKVSRKTVGFPHDTLLVMVLFLMTQLKAALGYEERAVLVLLFHVIGRAMELASTTWESASWDPDRDMLVFDWGDIKTGRQYEMTLHPHHDGWEMDPIHALACYLMCGSPSYKASASVAEMGVNFIFPQYKLSDGGAAGKVSDIIDKCRKAKVEGIPDEAASQSCRVAATDDMLFNTQLSFFAAIARGGWKCKVDSLIFYYLTQKVHVAEAGRALSHWPNPKDRVYAPSLDVIITDRNRRNVELLCQNLFMYTPIASMLNGRLKGFRNVMVASVLMYLKPVKKALGNDCLLAKAVNDAASGLFSPLEILQFGDDIAKHFKIKNAVQLAEGGNDQERLKAAFTTLQDLALQNLDVSKDLRDELKKNTAMTANVQDVVNDLHNMISNMPMNYTPRKAARHDSMIDVHSPASVGGPPQVDAASAVAARASAQPDGAARASTQPDGAARASTQSDGVSERTAPSALAAARPVSAAMTSSNGVATNAFEEMFQTNKRNTSVNWNELGDWDLPKLLMRCLRHRENPNDLTTKDRQSAKFLKLLPSKQRSLRNRARDLLLDLERVAVEEDRANRQYFDYNKNHLSPEDENEYIIAVGDKAKAWTQIVIRQCFSVQEEIANNIPDDGERKKRLAKITRSHVNQKVNVTALAGLLERKKKSMKTPE